MAEVVTMGLAVMFLVLATVPMVHSHKQEITVYAIVIPDGPKANIIPVAGNPNQPINATEFGTVSVFDIASTEGTDPNSPLVCRSQGIQVITSTDRSRAYLSFSNYFVRGKYNGSTVQVQGTVGLSGLGYDGELSVIGGTKSFRGEMGYARLRTVRRIPGTNNVVNKLEFFLKCVAIFL